MSLQVLPLSLSPSGRLTEIKTVVNIRSLAFFLSFVSSCTGHIQLSPGPVKYEIFFLLYSKNEVKKTRSISLFWAQNIGAVMCVVLCIYHECYHKKVEILIVLLRLD